MIRVWINWESNLTISKVVQVVSLVQKIILHLLDANRATENLKVQKPRLYASNYFTKYI